MRCYGSSSTGSGAAIEEEQSHSSTSSGAAAKEQIAAVQHQQQSSNGGTATAEQQRTNSTNRATPARDGLQRMNKRKADSQHHQQQKSKGGTEPQQRELQKSTFEEERTSRKEDEGRKKPTVELSSPFLFDLFRGFKRTTPTFSFLANLPAIHPSTPILKPYDYNLYSTSVFFSSSN